MPNGGNHHYKYLYIQTEARKSSAGYTKQIQSFNQINYTHPGSKKAKIPTKNVLKGIITIASNFKCFQRIILYNLSLPNLLFIVEAKAFNYEVIVQLEDATFIRGGFILRKIKMLLINAIRNYRLIDACLSPLPRNRCREMLGNDLIYCNWPPIKDNKTTNKAKKSRKEFCLFIGITGKYTEEVIMAEELIRNLATLNTKIESIYISNFNARPNINAMLRKISASASYTTIIKNFGAQEYVDNVTNSQIFVNLRESQYSNLTFPSKIVLPLTTNPVVVSNLDLGICANQVTKELVYCTNNMEKLASHIKNLSESETLRQHLTEYQIKNSCSYFNEATLRREFKRLEWKISERNRSN